MQIPGPFRLVTSNSGTGALEFLSCSSILSKSVDAAATDVSGGHYARGRRSSPVDLPSPPTFTKTNPNDQPIMYVGITSDSATQGQLFDYAQYASRRSASAFSPGVSQVAVYGAQSAGTHQGRSFRDGRAPVLTIDDLTAALKTRHQLHGSRPI